MSDIVNVFGQSLQPNPTVAIQMPPAAQPEPPGPAHKVQFVVELVGPKSLPAASAATLLGPQWFEALGKPEIYAMAPADRSWRTLTPAVDGSYDSLALAWDLVSDRGLLTIQSAAHLLKVAEGFASQVQRRAMPLPPPADVDRTVRALSEIKDGLDIGVEVLIVPRGAEFAERDVWIALSELGYDLAPSGFFELHSQGLDVAHLTVIPTGGGNSFSLGAVLQGVKHPGLMIGFNVPTSHNPDYAMDAMFQTASHLCKTLNAAAFTDDDQALDSSARRQLQSFLKDGIASLRRVGMEPGSRAALKLFA